MRPLFRPTRRASRGPRPPGGRHSSVTHRFQLSPGRSPGTMSRRPVCPTPAASGARTPPRAATQSSSSATSRRQPPNRRSAPELGQISAQVSGVAAGQRAALVRHPSSGRVSRAGTYRGPSATFERAAESSVDKGRSNPDIEWPRWPAEAVASAGGGRGARRSEQTRAQPAIRCRPTGFSTAIRQAYLSKYRGRSR
jgi:hypothetical protein